MLDPEAYGWGAGKPEDVNPRRKFIRELIKPFK